MVSVTALLPKQIRYHIESLLVRLACCVFRTLPVNNASALGGYITRTIGPLLPRNRIARNNLKRALPELDKAGINRITTDMWDNFGRSFAEFPHMDRLDDAAFLDMVTLEGVEHIEAAARSGKGTIFLGAHLANWEVVPRLFSLHGYPISIVYRKANNPGLEKFIQQIRDHYQAVPIPKGKTGSHWMLQTLKQGGRISMLVDQKMNDGIKTKFFGMDAMTAPAIARLALKYDYPILPARIVRINGPRHKITVFPPLKITRSGNTDQDVCDIMNHINTILEGWIREHPGQWTWFHNRWPPESAY
jgi:KDO2-lipid IV(A) lauroyltransferase